MIKTHAADKEDLIVWDTFVNQLGYNPKDIKYFEIGANDPIICSNTYLFYVHGASGILIEPLPNWHQYYAEIRPRDISLHMAIDDIDVDEKNKTTWIKKIGRKGGGSRICCEKPNASDKRRWEVPVHNINNIFQKYFVPDYISIDTEGRDDSIIKSINKENLNKIKVLCAETNDNKQHLEKIYVDIGFTLVQHTADNSIFVNSN